MNTFIRNFNIQPADVIICPKSGLNFVQHYVIYLGQDEWGNDIFAENKVGHGVRTIYYDLFAAENPTFNRINRFNGNEYQRSQAIQRALSLIGRKYNVTNFNCEHYANYVQGYKTESKQVETGFALAGIALLIFSFAALGSK